MSDFRLNEEVRIEIEENLQLKDISVQEIMDELLLDKVFLNSITVAIYSTMVGQLEAKNSIEAEKVNEQLSRALRFNYDVLNNKQ